MGRRLANRTVNPIGLGVMSLSGAYGNVPDRTDAVRLLNTALDLGYNHLDTASLYGLGHNESLIASAIGHRRDEFFLASKCGMKRSPEGRVIDGSPANIRQTLDESLQRLGVDHIDLYYLHRLDPNVPIEESAGALGELVREGKIGAIGLSEISAATLRLAHAEHPIAAVQNEYSLTSRNCELGILETTKALGIALVAFSPVGRGWLADAVHHADYQQGDLRSLFPRFTSDALRANTVLLTTFRDLAAEHSLTPAQLSLAWLLSQGDHIHAIPGTSSIPHLHENFAAPRTALSTDLLAKLNAHFPPNILSGTRYPPHMQIDIDTEEFA
ncbi:aldo/keto reductase [Sphingopyxis yananensis]|uniref:aldo/keto reductase n=1 Tax=Sphingopyxis yananensis TaxID=2886687 RepID=UPI001D10F519|nr:aldo/keto reductase [Sphingopyxis yananensis]MCC2601689.1 aldo/keto reductase [Sphingopyxis yananensis]